MFTDRLLMYARSIFQYDENGNLVLFESYGIDGKLKENSLGITRLINKYDESNRMILSENYDSVGKLKNQIDGHARKVMQYDGKGNRTLEEYFGADGNLSEHKAYKYARFIFQYDINGNRTLEEYHGIDGKLKEPSIYGFARKVMQHDGKGNKILEEYYGADGKLKKYLFGNARIVSQYNETCLSKSKEHVKKNQNCISYQEIYNQNEVLTEVYKNIFNSSGEFIENIRLTDLIGTKKWSHTNNQFRFEEKIEQIKEKRTIKKENQFVEEEVSFPVLNKSSYHLEFPNPRGTEGKRKVIVELDKLYRPAGVSFE